MGNDDLGKIREYIEDIRSYINDTSDRGVSGQWNTFQYVANSPITISWAETRPVGAKVLQDLRKRSDDLKQYMEHTLEFCQLFDDLIVAQMNTNNKEYR